ncbi:tRNA N6-adenosine(37)-threonylcarbamoyltransferase complex transferase subunit TsaD [Chloroflexus islandicus]|uniref:tRNA N6-adenosine threonylcarbamoyltransferase n=1 Tax=Chloroflexus islandicus TaxID=1707952 RepID=A0A178MCR3_9CHLR|nr:tRNA (adenosine(37)-N6)-threonylcarbamoyltransferase complex transferase subunit TsaD [Chloroflexus islandicus]OAN45835.1 tRNA N6-adenosine(37)-threonylcarbamoyltransferase complex transferase subunit TsaD [Chloroflexus islandicus]
MNQLPDDFTILALETSCDETAAAVVRGGRTVVSNIVASQMATHERYGGVVPEIASRQHILSLAPVVRAALAALPNGWNDVHAVAATHGPGLSGALLTGLNAAKAMAWQRGLPFVAVNHLEAHLYAGWLGSDPPPPFPLVALLVSGGHTLLALIRDHGQYDLLGQTRDDAAGEAFDKVARILGLGYPGGPAIQAAAAQATPGGVLPRAWLRDSYDFSFSGLKTAVLHRVQDRLAQAARLSGRKGGNDPAQLDAPFVAQMAYAFQESVVDVLVSKTVDAARRHGAQAILLAGGVAANRRLREELIRRAHVPVHLPALDLCTDNAAMVAAAAFYRFHAGVQHGWDVDVTANLPLGAS